MTIESMISFISVAGMIISMFFAFRNNKRADKTEIEAKAVMDAEVKSQLGHLIDDVKDIKAQNKAYGELYSMMNTNQEIMKRDLKTAFNKIDELKAAIR